MLIKAEKILTYDNYDNILLDKSPEEIFNIVRRELIEKMVDDCIGRGLVKIEVLNELHDDFGKLIKVRASLRIYNPDD